MSRGLRLLAVSTAGLVLCFASPLFGLVKLALHSELYSHILLIPFVSLYLVWTMGILNFDLRFLISSKAKGEPPGRSPQSEIRNQKSKILLPLAAGLLSIGAYLVLGSRMHLAPVDSLSWTVFSFFLLFVAACCFCLDRQTLRALAFPIGFLVFITPFPAVVTDALEAFLQHRSADAAELLFGLVGTPLLRHDVAFQLPGFSLQVAPECSGIRSTLVLFITSLVAGQLFLRTPWKRALFALLVVPLGIFRNAFRIVTIGELCVHLDPSYIDSPIHHRGGPVFFVISMVPFLLLLWYLRRTDMKGESGKMKAEN